MKAHISFIIILCGSLVQFLVRAELKCSSANTSVIGVAFDSSQNQTGDWQHSIVLSKRGLQSGHNADKDDVPWNVEVGYQPVYCDVDLKDKLSVKITLSKRLILNKEYRFYPGLGYYKYHPTMDTWPVAKEACEREGAHLAIINSQQEADALKQLIVSDDWARIGFMKHDAKGEFISVFGDPISKLGYSKWYPGVNPMNAAANHVAVLHKTEGTLGYVTNDNKRPSICELDL